MTLRLDPNFCAILRFGLLHSLWQAVGFALCALVFARGTPRRRYAILLGFEFLIFTVFLVTLALGPGKLARVTEASNLPIAPATTFVATGVSPGQVHRQTPLAPAAPPRLAGEPRWIVAAYLLGVSVMLLRLVVGLWGGKRMVARSRPIVQAHVLLAIARAVQSMELAYTPAIAYCNAVVVPSVVGVLRPTLLLPFSVLSGMAPNQIEVLVMHELAHVQRHDHIFNLLQRTVEAFLFYHPAVWLLGRRIRQERELCCDDMVIAAGTPADHYANSLLRMVELGVYDPPTRMRLVTLAADGHRASLKHRVVRLLKEQQSPPIRLQRLGAMAASLLVGIMLATPLLAMRSVPLSGPLTLPAKPLITSNYKQIAPINWPELHMAVVYGTLEDVAMVLRNGSDPDVRQAGGWSALHLAAALNRRDIMALLLDAGADPNAQSESGRTPLHAAFGASPAIGPRTPRKVERETTQMLLNHGAKPDIADDNGFTALHHAIGRRDRQIIEDILNAGASLNRSTIDGMLPLHLACSLVPPDPVLLQLLLDHGADPKAIDPRGRNGLDMLCLQNHLLLSKVRPAADLLMAAGIQPDITAAIVLGIEQSLRRALSADPSIVNRIPSKTVERNSLLHWAALSGDPRMCEVLVSAGADVNATNASGDAPIMLAVQSPEPNLDVIRALIRAGAALNPTGQIDTTPLVVAVGQESPDVLKLLLDAGAQATFVNSSGQSLFHRLTMAEARQPHPSRLEMARQLLAAGGDLNRADSSGSTPLHLATKGNCGSLVQFYLEHGATPNVVDNTGRSPLLIAVTSENASLPIISALLAHGGDPNFRDASGQSAAQLAARSSNATLKQLFVPKNGSPP